MILHLFTALFVALKLMGYITWSWWLVLLPSIIAITLTLLVIGFAIWLQVKVSKW